MTHGFSDALSRILTGRKIPVHIVGEDCYEDVEYQDDSFSHAFGTEHIASYFCAKCGRHLPDYEPEERW